MHVRLAARQTFATENGFKFICLVVILGHNRSLSFKSSNIKFLMWFQEMRKNILSKAKYDKLF